MTTLLSELDAFYLEHRRCDELDASIEGERVWMACSCGADLYRLCLWSHLFHQSCDQT